MSQKTVLHFCIAKSCFKHCCWFAAPQSAKTYRKPYTPTSWPHCQSINLIGPISNVTDRGFLQSLHGSGLPISNSRLARPRCVSPYIYIQIPLIRLVWPYQHQSTRGGSLEVYYQDKHKARFTSLQRFQPNLSPVRRNGAACFECTHFLILFT